jgi:hypothetical protein
MKHPNLCNQVTSQLLILLECSKLQLANQAPKIGTKSWFTSKSFHGRISEEFSQELNPKIHCQNFQ